MALLCARQVGRKVQGQERWLLRDVNLKVFAGDRIALHGPSGSGKSLLLRTLALLEPSDEGEILWHGQPPAPRKVPSFRSHVAYLHQQPALFPGTVADNLALPLRFGVNAGCALPSETRRRCEGTCSRAGE